MLNPVSKSKSKLNSSASRSVVEKRTYTYQIHECQRQQYLIANAVYSNGPRNLSSRLTNPQYQHLASLVNMISNLDETSSSIPSLPLVLEEH